MTMINLNTGIGWHKVTVVFVDREEEDFMLMQNVGESAGTYTLFGNHPSLEVGTVFKSEPSGRNWRVEQVATPSNRKVVLYDVS